MWRPQPVREGKTVLSHPPISPVSHLQSFLALVNVLYSSYAVWELLGQQQLPNKAEYSLREMPVSIIVSPELSLGIDCAMPV